MVAYGRNHAKGLENCIFQPSVHVSKISLAYTPLGSLASENENFF